MGSPTLAIALARAINCIEILDNAGEQANVEGLRQFCTDNGLGEDTIDALLTEPGPTDPGRIGVIMQNMTDTEEPEEAPALDDDDALLVGAEGDTE